VRHKNTVATVPQTLGVGLKTEYAYFAILATKSLEPFKGALAIVQTGCRHVKAYILVCGKFHSTPCTILVVATHVAICLSITEPNVRPIHIFHFHIIFFLIRKSRKITADEKIFTGLSG
jgi:hypothetical protein